ncbi:MAG: hypothetical protein HZA16_13405 [Nitrospirae bacterium]|nr:hypothetical protein [Nitrospirota bacterium]
MKRIYLKIIVLTSITIISVASYNYLTDPYGIFRITGEDLAYEPGYEPNQHYAKMRHIIKDKHAWDSFLFGSSRVGKINPALIPGGKYYNMNYSEGVPGEHLADIRIMLQEGLPVKNIIIGLDNTSYAFRPDDHRGQILRHPYDESVFRRIIFQIKYLCAAPRIGIGRYMRFKNNEPLVTFGIPEDGMQDLKKVDAKIESNIEGHLNNERFNEVNDPFSGQAERDYLNLINDTIRDIDEIIELSEAYNFNVYFFISPTHYKFYLQSDPCRFLLFKEKLAQITDYWDFSGINSVTTSNYYYYETSHYRTIVGDLIVCRMTNCSGTPVPADFGVLINSDNINQHVKDQKEKLIAYKAKQSCNDQQRYTGIDRKRSEYAGARDFF